MARWGYGKRKRIKMGGGKVVGVCGRGGVVYRSAGPTIGTGVLSQILSKGNVKSMVHGLLGIF